MSDAAFAFFTALAIIFLAMQLAGTVTWPWFVVLAPIWGPLVLWAVFYAVAYAVVIYQILRGGLIG